MLVSSLLLVLAPLVASVPVQEYHDHSVEGRLAGRWYQDSEHSVNALFRRATTDGTTYADVGSPSK